MKNFAQLDSNNIVENIIVTNDDFNEIGFVEYNENNSAQIGFIYDSNTNSFRELSNQEKELFL